MPTEKNVIESTLYKGKVSIRFFPDSHQYWMNGVRKTGATTIIGILDKSMALIPWATELCSEFLIQKLKDGHIITEEHVYEAEVQHSVKKQEAADTGSKIHDWCERYIRHKLKEKGFDKPDMPEENAVIVGVMAFLDWEKEHKVKFISSERIVYSKKYDYMGKMDIEATVDGELCLIDLKSSNGLYNSVRMQTAAYVKADEEERGKKIYTGRWAIRLSKETETEYLDRMQKKAEKAIRKGKEPREIKPYEVFEAKYLDENKGDIENDFEAFLAALTLFKWNKATDFFYNK
jgi:hypothetical protein